MQFIHSSEGKWVSFSASNKALFPSTLVKVYWKIGSAYDDWKSDGGLISICILLLCNAFKKIALKVMVMVRPSDGFISVSVFAVMMTQFLLHSRSNCVNFVVKYILWWP